MANLEIFISKYKAHFKFMPAENKAELSEWNEFISSIQESQMITLFKEMIKEYNGKDRPGLADVKQTYNRLFNREGGFKKYPGHILEAAKKLGIPPNRVPESARDLTPEQRQRLNLPNYARFIKNLDGIPIDVEFSDQPFEEVLCAM